MSVMAAIIAWSFAAMFVIAWVTLTVIYMGITEMRKEIKALEDEIHGLKEKLSNKQGK